ncbi:unnamed protein product, partial [Prorocentrum cordatum]
APGDGAPCVRCSGHVRRYQRVLEGRGGRRRPVAAQPAGRAGRHFGRRGRPRRPWRAAPGAGPGPGRGGGAPAAGGAARVAGGAAGRAAHAGRPGPRDHLGQSDRLRRRCGAGRRRPGAAVGPVAVRGGAAAAAVARRGPGRVTRTFAHRRTERPR